MAVEQTTTEHPVRMAAPRVSVNNTKLAIWIFLASEIIFFTALIGGSLLLRINTQQSEGWPRPGAILNVPLTSLNTFILIISSLTVVNALSAIERGDQRKLRLWLIATVLLGATFLGIQMFEYIKLTSEGLLFNACNVTEEGKKCPTMYSTTFFIQTGFHGTHVFIGVIWLLTVILKSFRGYYTQAEHTGVEIFGLYWHFVDLVWILLFTIVYLI